MNQEEIKKLNHGKVGRPFKDDESRKSYKITIRVKKDFNDEIKKLADDKGLTVAEFIRLTIDEYKKNNSGSNK